MDAQGHTHDTEADDRRWLAATWPFVRDSLPDPPGRVIEIGGGDLGGCVIDLQHAGYEACASTRRRPAGCPSAGSSSSGTTVRQPVDAIIACTSLHHVADLDVAVDKIAEALVPGRCRRCRGVGARAVRRGHGPVVFPPAVSRR